MPFTIVTAPSIGVLTPTRVAFGLLNVSFASTSIVPGKLEWIQATSCCASATGLTLRSSVWEARPFWLPSETV
ncbi:hypothetical protein D3C75_1073280 [compost metagenome]